MKYWIDESMKVEKSDEMERGDSQPIFYLITRQNQFHFFNFDQ